VGKNERSDENRAPHVARRVRAIRQRRRSARDLNRRTRGDRRSIGHTSWRHAQARRGSYARSNVAALPIRHRRSFEARAVDVGRHVRHGFDEWRGAAASTKLKAPYVRAVRLTTPRSGATTFATGHADSSLVTPSPLRSITAWLVLLIRTTTGGSLERASRAAGSPLSSYGWGRADDRLLSAESAICARDGALW